MGTRTFLENIVVQPKTFWRILHHWQTSTSPNIPLKTIWHKLLNLTNSSHSKKRKESVHHWQNRHYVFYNQSKSFNWRYFMSMILKQHSVRIEWQERNAPLLKSQRRILLYPTLTVTGEKHIEGLDTKANRHEWQSDQEQALIVNSALIELLEKANKQKTQPKKISKRICQHEKNIWHRLCIHINGE